MKDTLATTLLAMLALVCWPANVPAAESDDVQQIRAQLSSMFDKPGAKVVADPVVVSGGHAIASWTQDEMGGRALLLRENGKWTLVACAGDGLKEAKALESAGIPKDSAEKLSRQLAAAESRVPEERRKRFSLFGPMVDARAAHAPSTAAKH